jgi:hypothetical protein
MHSNLLPLQLFDYVHFWVLLVIQEQITQLRYLLVVQLVKRRHDVFAVGLASYVIQRSCHPHS